MPRDFHEARAAAREIERLVARWLIARGFAILPAYDYSGLGDDKPPRLERASNPLVVPDLLAARGGALRWVEVKWKTKADFTRITKRLETGIDRRHWEHYLEVERITGVPVWLAFVHETEGEIRGQRIACLEWDARESPNFNNGRGGVFFDYLSLPLMARLSEVRAAA